MITRKIGERNIEAAVLYILFTRGPQRTQPTSQLKSTFISLLNPVGINLEPLWDRNDTAIHQIIGNIVSHRNTSSNNLINRGLVHYDGNSLTITSDGIAALDNYILSGLIDDLNN